MSWGRVVRALVWPLKMIGLLVGTIVSLVLLGIVYLFEI